MNKMLDWSIIKNMSADLLVQCIPSAHIPMQFTGLKDKNGKEIYEGDIIIRVSEKAMYTKNPQKIPKNIVQWKHAGFYLRIDVEYEVIGNIYENPNLIN